MQNSSWSTRAEVARRDPNTHGAANPDKTKPRHLAPSNEPQNSNARKDKEHCGGSRRLSLGEARRIQVNCAPWSLKVNPLAQHPALA
jgi:hypothetical protein